MDNKVSAVEKYEKKLEEERKLIQPMLDRYHEAHSDVLDKHEEEDV